MSIHVCLCIVLLTPIAVIAAQAQPVTVMIAYTSLSPQYAPVWIAREAGLFKKYGVNAQLIYMRGGVMATQALVSGEVHFINAGGGDMKIYNTVGDLSTRTDLVKNRRDLLRAFFMASGEAIALGKKNKALVQRVIGKHMKVTDRKRLDVVYEASLGRMPSKPYPREEAVQLELESVAFTDPIFKNRKAAEFMDSSIVAELDRKGFFAQLQTQP